MLSACENSRPRTLTPARCEDSSMWNNCLARSTASAGPSSLIQPSREVAFTPSWLSIAFRFCGSLLKSCWATRAFSKCKVSVGIRLIFDEGDTQSCRHVFQGVWHHGRIRDHRHEIRIAVPARHDMNVQMFHNAGARDRPE